MSADPDDAARNELIVSLKKKQCVLMVGAGSSKLVGFPLWRELIEQLRLKLTPQLVLPTGIDLDVAADLIKNQVLGEGGRRDYERFLEQLFDPLKNSYVPIDFHVNLVRLGFCGIVTTNYDGVLEEAVIRAFSSGSSGIHKCWEIDLCAEKPYRVFDFLRSLSPGNNHQRVLHLHGYYRNSDQLILTRTDYERRYGLHNGVALDTLHRKVIWSLLVMHPLVFVGFSLSDPFFIQLLELVQKDFEIGADPAHFAIMSFTTDDEKETIYKRLKQLGVQAVFYHVPPSSSPDQSRDYRALVTLISELQGLVTPIQSPVSLEDLNRKMLGL